MDGNLSIRVKVQDDQIASMEQNFTIVIGNENEAPVITNGATITINLQEDGNVTDSTLVANDPDLGDTLTWSSIFYGDRNETITLNGTGISPNFLYQPIPNFNGIENLVVRVTDAAGLFAECNVTLNVAAVDDAPIIVYAGGGTTANVTIPENQRTVGTIGVTESDGEAFTYQIIGGVDSAQFTIEPNTGELSFITSPDYESPGDSNGDLSYEVTVRVTDTNGNQDQQAISIAVQNMIDLSTFIFSNAGSVGPNGPQQPAVNNAYQGTDLDAMVTVATQGIQEVIIPFGGDFSIEALGASGGKGRSGGSQGGLGAKMSGAFTLTAGEKIYVVVGQMGTDSSRGGSGGGGSFVWRLLGNGTRELLIAAGGGGGGADGYNANTQIYGMTTETGGNSVGTGGTNGADGNLGGTHTSYAGRGWNGNAFTGMGTGGFGGGGGGNNHASGGGGGYSGGGSSSCGSISGGGGGSFNSGTSPFSQAGANEGHGKVIISALNTPPSDIALSNHSLPENLSANSQVGLFSTTDPDDSNGTGNYIYSLVSGTGDTDNALFNLDANGTLTILSTSDYEQRLIDSNTTTLLHTDLNASFLEGNYSADLYLTPQVQYPTWSIRVRTSDDVNASYEEVILIASLDRDDTIPVITFDGNGTRTQTPWTYIPPPVYDASDNVDGNITQLVITDGNLTTEQPGIYYLHHDVTDVAGNNATRITFALTVVNQNPTDLHLSNAFVEENLPVGTHVGIFSTTDPDDLNNTRPYTYQLIINPSQPPPPFQLDTNGTLTTNSILDFESIESYSIRVRTTDQFGGTYEEDFVIYVVDAFPPYVETGKASLGADGRFTLYGTVVDEGGISGILERGFVISPKPISTLVDAGITKVLSTVNDNNFSASFTPSLAGKKHFFRAYAITAESDFLGTEETFTPAAIPSPGYWSDAKPSGAGADWWESSWFGSYYTPDTNQWIMHSELGWLFPSPSMDSGVWFWKDGLKWLWTDSKTFPFLHSIDQGSWLYFYGNVGEKRLFYAYASQKWIVLENGVIVENTTSVQNPDNPDDTGQADNPDLTGQQAGTTTADPK